MSGFFFGFSKDIGECYAKGEPFEEKLIEWFILIIFIYILL